MKSKLLGYLSLMFAGLVPLAGFGQSTVTSVAQTMGYGLGYLGQLNAGLFSVGLMGVSADWSVISASSLCNGQGTSYLAQVALFMVGAKASYGVQTGLITQVEDSEEHLWNGLQLGVFNDGGSLQFGLGNRATGGGLMQVGLYNLGGVVQFGLWSGSSTDTKLQFDVFSWNEDDEALLQFGVCNWSEAGRRISQIGAVNISDKADRLVQVGALNWGGGECGSALQIGLLNWVGDKSGSLLQIGLLNWNEVESHPCMALVNWSFK